jgi:hypothetical protein
MFANEAPRRDEFEVDLLTWLVLNYGIADGPVTTGGTKAKWLV